MISVSVPKEISDYKEKVIFGLSLRQLVCGVIAVGVAVATGLLLVQVHVDTRCNFDTDLSTGFYKFLELMYS